MNNRTSYHTPQGFLALQGRLSETLKTLATEKGVRLIDVIWMDGAMLLPTQERIVLDGAAVKTWLEGSPWPHPAPHPPGVMRSATTARTR